MSHPFTMEYMMRGELEYNQNRLKDNRPDTNAQSPAIMPQVKMSAEIDDDDDGDIENIVEANDIQHTDIIDEQKLGFWYVLKLTLRRRFTAFALEGSIAYMSHLVESSSSARASVGRKILWTFLLLFGLGFMTYQFYDRISFYLSYPTVSDYRMAYNASLPFPAVTICPEIRGSRRRVSDIFGPAVADTVALAVPPFPDIDLKTDYKSLNSSFWDIDWRKIFVSAAPPLNEIMIQCEFRQRPCNLKNDIATRLNDVRLCFTINTETSNFRTSMPGVENGLRLVLYANQSDVLIAASQAAGFKVILHDPSEDPSVSFMGFKVSPGVSTGISFSFRNISQLPAPYGYCRAEKGYTLLGCVTKCGYNYIARNCNCSIEFSGNFTFCNPEQFAGCVLVAFDSFISTGASRKCDCPLHCNQRSYPYTVSSSPMSQHYLNRTSRRPDFRGRNIDMSRLNREVLFLDIFYSKLTYVNIQTRPAYDALKLFGDLGGSLGLILGGTVLTVFEGFQFVFELVADIMSASRLHRKLRSAKHPI